jgi:hypothetical protein
MQTETFMPPNVLFEIIPFFSAHSFFTMKEAQFDCVYYVVCSIFLFQNMVADFHSRCRFILKQSMLCCWMQHIFVTMEVDFQWFVREKTYLAWNIYVIVVTNECIFSLDENKILLVWNNYLVDGNNLVLYWKHTGGCETKFSLMETILSVDRK